MAYVRQFATITTNTLFYWKWPHSPSYYSFIFVNGQLTFNLRGSVLSKWRKLWIWSVKLELFLDLRSKLASIWCFVRFIINEHPINSKSFAILKCQVNKNPRGGFLLKWKELYNSSVLVCFFLGQRSKLAYVRQFATIVFLLFVDGQLMLNLRGGVWCKWSKSFLSNVNSGAL